MKQAKSSKYLGFYAAQEFHASVAIKQGVLDTVDAFETARLFCHYSERANVLAMKTILGSLAEAAQQRIEEKESMALYDDEDRSASPVATGGFGGLSSANTGPTPQFEIRNNKSVEFLSNFRMSSPPAQT